MRGSRKQSGWLRANCPFCVQLRGTEDRRSSFGILVERGVYHCFRCEVSGRVEEVGRANDSEEMLVPTGARNFQPVAYVPLWTDDAKTSASLAPALNYLVNGRGLSFDVIEAAEVGACLTGFFSGRIIVPVFSGRAWAGFSARGWGVRAKKYLYPAGMRRSVLIYNEAVLSIETDVPALVVEGVFDALAYWPNAVALLGKASEWQRGFLAQAKRPLAVALDGDAWEDGKSLAVKLRLDGACAGSVRLPPLKDPDQVPRDDLISAARACVGTIDSSPEPVEL